MKVLQKSRFSEPETITEFAVFPTDLGWFGLVGSEEVVSYLSIGHSTEFEVHQQIASHIDQSDSVIQPDPTDWFPELREQLERYAAGESIDHFSGQFFPLQSTSFQMQVLQTVQQIPYGQMLTYAEVASRSGSPKSARAVGNVMASNACPILIPCHRVVGSNGNLGGFSAPQGVSLKRKMLDLESVPIK